MSHDDGSQGTGASGTGPAGTPPSGTPYGQVPPGYLPPGPGYAPGYGPVLRDPDARPGTVTAAGIVTLVCSGLVLLLFALFTVLLLVARSSFVDGFSESANVSYLEPDSLYLPLLIGMLVVVAWSLLAVFLAIGVLRRSNLARILLVISSGLTAVVSLLAITGGGSVVTLAGSVAVIVLLFTGGASDWFHHEHPYSPPQQPTV